MIFTGYQTVEGYDVAYELTISEKTVVLQVYDEQEQIVGFDELTLEEVKNLKSVSITDRVQRLVLSRRERRKDQTKEA